MADYSDALLAFATKMLPTNAILYDQKKIERHIKLATRFADSWEKMITIKKQNTVHERTRNAQ